MEAVAAMVAAGRAARQQSGSQAFGEVGRAAMDGSRGETRRNGEGWK